MILHRAILVLAWTLLLTASADAQSLLLRKILANQAINAQALSNLYQTIGNLNSLKAPFLNPFFKPLIPMVPPLFAPGQAVFPPGFLPVPFGQIQGFPGQVPQGFFLQQVLGPPGQGQFVFVGGQGPPPQQGGQFPPGPPEGTFQQGD
ncbi:uncharacterized protein LOC132197523 [Neocloeon triangulifer]|uniref:uncharacterized protein LOC132197523 n=1 Tax=Neocloeon triangulifer TaxID=2078957 RepID=UPI00286F8487|nr:uncharacterized protein LOC132197523 [Neocloeon triangulifer]